MFNKKYLIYILVFSFIVLAGCSKVLDKTNLNAFNGDQIFKNLNLSRSYLSYIYDENSPGWPDEWMEVSDETAGESRYFEGTVQVETVDNYGTSVSSNNVWGKLRMINTMIQNIKESTLAANDKQHLKGQALFFRAYRYFKLVRLYGGVPLVLKPQDAISKEAREQALLPRNTTSECIAQIIKDLDSAVACLPGRWENDEDWGRITSGAALALKGRVLLTWASPQFNPNDEQSRWQAAYDANQKAINVLKENGFHLNEDYQNMWFEEVGNPEAVWVVGFNNSSSDQLKRNEGWDASNRPGYLGGSGSNQPTKEIVDAFPMLNGLDITNPNSGYNAVLFYKNRDPRFYATIGFNGCTYPISENKNYRLWTYTVDGTGTMPNTPNSGFYCRKALNPNLKLEEVQYAGTDWMEIRYAEVILNLAEGACGIGKLNEAYAGLKKIRDRAGIDPGNDGMYGLKPNMTRDEMFKAILHERQIEFAFEGKRFWDLRRWKLFEEMLNGTRRTGVAISLNTDAISDAEFNAIRDTVSLSKAYKEYFMVETEILDTRYEINWQPNYYFFAIPQDAIDNNPNLEQTKGWPGGSFDPLK